MSKYLLLASVIVLFQTSNAYVDALSTDDMLFIAWTSSGQSHLIISDSSAVRNFTSPEITIGEIHSNGELFISCAASDGTAGAPDSVFLLDPINLTTVSAYKIDPQALMIGSYQPEDVMMSIRVARHTMSDTPVFISTEYVTCVPPGELGVTTARFVPDTLSMELTLSEARVAVLSYTYCGIKSLTSPISCSQMEPMCFWLHYFDWHGIDISFFSGIHNIPSDKHLGLDTSIFNTDHCYYQTDMPRLKAAGSCMDEILLLWISAFDEKMYCASFNATGPDTTDTYQFPFPIPPPESPWAMSCNPDDQGLLFVWYDAGSIIARHYSDEWNHYSHPVQSGLSSIEEGNLSVCSDDDGYWVSWLESGKSDPQFVFVPRDSLTSIEESETTPDGTEANIYPLMNPVHGSLRFNAEGYDGSFDVFIYDITGRLKIHQNFSNEENIIFNETLPLGAYIVRCVSGILSSSCRILVI